MNKFSSLLHNVFLVLAAFSQVAIASDSAERPNIVWLSTEDIGPHLGCYGYKIKTPNIDAFAKRSLTFDVAWSNYPVCAPARTTIITGMYATALGAGNMRCAAVKPEGLKLLPELMREAGYYCTNASKTDYNLLDVEGVWDKSTKKAHWKNRPEGKPFFAVFNQTKTHESKVRKRPHKQQIDPATVSLFPYWPDTPEVRQDWAQYLDNIQTMDDWFARHLKQIEDAGLKDDTIVIFWGDHGAGMPRHKRYAGDSGMRVPFIVHVPEKWKALWSSNYVPGSRSNWPVGFVDLAPTMLKIAGAKIPQSMQGRSFLGPDAKKAKYVFGVRNRMDERYDVSRSISDGKYVFIRNFMPHVPHGQFVEFQQTTDTTRIWFEQHKAGKLNSTQAKFWGTRPIEELYDLQTDPFETKNLALDEAYSSKVIELRSELKSKMIEIVDLDLVPESTLFEYEQESGKSRSTFAQSDGFSLEKLYLTAEGKINWYRNVTSDRPEIRFWGITKMLEAPTNIWREACEEVAKCLDDPSMAVRVKAAEFCLTQKYEVENAVAELIRLANIETSNYYVAGNALDCLDRYRNQLDRKDLDLIKALPASGSKIKRGSNNLAKLMRRFKE